MQKEAKEAEKVLLDEPAAKRAKTEAGTQNGKPDSATAGPKAAGDSLPGDQAYKVKATSSAYMGEACFLASDS